jgi:hypothetical protein
MLTNARKTKEGGLCLLVFHFSKCSQKVLPSKFTKKNVGEIFEKEKKRKENLNCKMF